MHISDCSSDVCSSDLCGLRANTRLRLPIVSCWGCAGETAPIRSRPTGKPALIVEYDRLAAPGGVPILRCAEIEDVGTDLAERLAVRRHRLRTEERRLGTECVRQGRSRGSPYNT